ncbi:MAG TPA: SCO family protein [Blastocatellia bacterium]|jgi:protein SCO1/2|nr:SCO family protein [Blastocatellia bacterium]
MLLLIFAFTTGVASQEHSHQHPAPKTSNTPPSNRAAENYFTDVALINQNGEKMRLYSDLLKGKVVIINTFFTSCQTVCPPMTRGLAQIQEWLGDRLGKDVRMISISVDPATDTPPKLKQFGERFQARPGWFFLTGEKDNLELALRKIGQFVDNRDEHQTILIIGNERTGLWKKALGMARPEELIKIVESVLNDKGPASSN